MRPAYRVAHKYLALSIAVLWALQALSGILLVFHRSIDDRLLGASARPVDLKVVDTALIDIERTHGAKVTGYFSSGGVVGQLNVLVDRKSGGQDVVRIDGATGAVLRSSAWEEPRSELAVFRFILLFHKQLLAGNIGHWFIGISGGLLFLNIVLGLRLAWPIGKRWSAVLLPQKAKAPAVALLGWHRAIGLWLALFGLITALTGTLMVWKPQLQRALAADVAPPTANRPLGPNEVIVSPSTAAAAALHAYSRATIAFVTLPDTLHAWYAIRLRQPAELRRVFGTTLVYVDARTGGVLQSHDALTASPQTQLIDGLYPVHTGEWGGLATRLVTVTAGVWVLTVVSLGLALWWKRRRARGLSAQGLTKEAVRSELGSVLP